MSVRNQHKVLLIDCEDSFVHTLAGYFRIADSHVDTMRIGFNIEELQRYIDENKPDLVCLSPGPGSPQDFGLNAVIDCLRKNELPIFGVCLGLQALIEYFGGELLQLDNPMHGKVSQVDLVDDGGKIFKNIEAHFNAGRYHSLYANETKLPSQLIITARNHDDQIIMAIEHVSEPIAAVQFHPESIMTFDNNVGRRIVANACTNLN